MSTVDMSDVATSTAAAGSTVQPLLRTRGLTVAYPRGRRRAPFVALQDIDLDIAPGEVVGVVGESGSGKSTLGNAVLGTVPAASGRIEFEGGSAEELNNNELIREFYLGA